MPRGGSREGAGRKSTWASGCKQSDTKIIRVPIAIADQLLEIAHRLDAGEFLDFVTNSLSEAPSELTISTDLETKSKFQQTALEFHGSSELVTDSVPPTKSSITSLTLTDLAVRLGLHNSTLSGAKTRRSPSDFAQWAKQRDPDGIAWEYRKSEKKYFPVETPQVSKTSDKAEGSL